MGEEWTERYFEIMDLVRDGKITHEAAEELINSEDIFGEPRIMEVRVPTQEEYDKRDSIKAKFDSGELTKDEANELMEKLGKETEE